MSEVAEVEIPLALRLNYPLLGFLAWSGRTSDLSAGGNGLGVVFCVRPAGVPPAETMAIANSLDQLRQGASTTGGRVMFLPLEEAAGLLLEIGCRLSLIAELRAEAEVADPATQVLVVVCLDERSYHYAVSMVDGRTPQDCYEVISRRKIEFMI